MGIAFAIDTTEHNAVGARLRVSVPTVDLCQHGFHVWFTVLIFWIPPIESAQRFIERTVRLFRLRDQPQSELMHEPSFGTRIARWFHRLLAPLQHTLRVGERAFL